MLNSRRAVISENGLIACCAGSHDRRPKDARAAQLLPDSDGLEAPTYVPCVYSKQYVCLQMAEVVVTKELF